MNSSRSNRSGAGTDGGRVKNGSPGDSRMVTADRDDLMRWISDKIESYVHDSALNRFGASSSGPLFDEPIIGFASGADPLFSELKKVIGPFHMTPREALMEEAIRAKVPPPRAKDTGVIAYVLPIANSTRLDNSSMSSAPSHSWAYTRLYGERFNQGLESNIVSRLREQGYLAVAPDLSPSYKILMDDRIGPTSNWSHRHIAYAAGLGSFGLSDGFITRSGIAHRLGSVVVNVPFTSPKRGGIHQDCIYFQTGKCNACAKRCPVGAITADGHDKEKCREFVFSQIPYIRNNYHLDIYACGLCQTGVPCESKSPVSGSNKR
jgi:epoxyqueuosine reductase